MRRYNRPVYDLPKPQPERTPDIVIWQGKILMQVPIAGDGDLIICYTGDVPRQEVLEASIEYLRLMLGLWNLKRETDPVEVTVDESKGES